MPLLNEQFVAPAGGVGPGLRAVEDHRAIKSLRCLQPQANGEGLAAAKIAHRRLHRMIAGELDRLTDMPRHKNIFCRRTGGMIAIERAGKGALGIALIE